MEILHRVALEVRWEPVTELLLYVVNRLDSPEIVVSWSVDHIPLSRSRLIDAC